MFGNLPHSPPRRDLSKRVKTCRALSGPLPDLATNQKRDAIFFGVHPSGVQQTANDRRCSFRLLISQKPNAPGTSEVAAPEVCTPQKEILRFRILSFGFSFELCPSSSNSLPSPLSRSSHAAGSSSQNELPLPSSDSTPHVPPMRWTARATIARPMPVPS